MSTRVCVVGNGASAVDSAGLVRVNRHTVEFLIDLASRGLEVIFVQPAEAFRQEANLMDAVLPSLQVRTVCLRTRGMGVFGPLLRLVRVMLRSNFVYIFFPGTLPRLVALLCRVLRIPYGLYLRGQAFQTAGADARVFAGAKFVVTVSESLARTLPIEAERIVPIRPMLELSQSDRLLRVHTASGNRPIRLLFVGRLEKAKGVPELIEAARKLSAKRVEFCLTLVGGGPLYDELLELQSREPAMNIRVLGPIMERAKLMREYESADIFVLPTHHEGFPRVLYEAMIKSAVIVTTMVGGIPGLMHDQVNCLGIPVGDSDAIVTAILRASSDPVLMNSLISCAHETVDAALTRHPTHLNAFLRRFENLGV